MSTDDRAARVADFDLTLDEIRVVAAFAAAAAAEVLPVFEARHDDVRPRLALEAAQGVRRRAPRSRLQRVTAPAAHRAARSADDAAASHAAMAAGDAAAAAYLHPLADSAQVGHILRACAHAARACELDGHDDPAAADQALERAVERATPTLVDVLRRYPRTRPGRSRVAELMHRLDSELRR